MSQPTSSPVRLWLRHEVKAFERRTPLTPSNAAKLLAAGFEITVEQSPTRIFPDHEYAQAGCQLAATGSWPTAGPEWIILGLKELPEEAPTVPLTHRHIFFAHCYKHQSGWKDILARFKAGHGTLYDLEFLVDDHGRRVAAFGQPAGFVGTALGLLIWAHRILHGDTAPVPPVSHFPAQHTLVAHVRDQVRLAREKLSAENQQHKESARDHAASGIATLDAPRVIVIGAKGRCGSGAGQLVRLAATEEVPISLTEWDMAETARGGPFDEILAHDVFVNAIYLAQGSRVPPFLTLEQLRRASGRAGQSVRLSVLSDVSCDCTNPANPVPVYNTSTGWDTPVLAVAYDQTEGSTQPPLYVTAIDNLPSVLPRESSADFSDALLPHLLDLAAGSPVWERADALFRAKVAEAAADS